MFRPRLRAPAALGSGTSLARRPAQSLLSPLAQTAAAASPSSQATQATAPSACRRIHSLPMSRHDDRVGVPHLLSPEGFDLAWTQHMTLTLSKLNQLTTGTDYEDRDLKNIILDSARVPALASVFNHASMAHNTDFFFKQLVPSTASSATAAPKEIPAPLRIAIEENFGSVDTLRREFAAIAQAMFGPGFVWLVKANGLHQSGRGGDNLRLLTTYLAGSPYPGAHWRRQATDMNTVGEEGGDGKGTPGAPGAARQWIDRQAAAVAGGPPMDLRPPGGIEVIPLLCLSTWEHVWLRDYGLGANGHGGKAAFVEAWWNVVDWEAVADLASLNRLKLKT